MKTNKFNNWIIENFIKEAWEDLTTIGKIAIFIPWSIKCILVGLSIPILYMVYKFTETKFYLRLEKKYIEIYLDSLIMYNTMMSEMSKNNKNGRTV